MDYITLFDFVINLPILLKLAKEDFEAYEVSTILLLLWIIDGIIFIPYKKFVSVLGIAGTLYLFILWIWGITKIIEIVKKKIYLGEGDIYYLIGITIHLSFFGLLIAVLSGGASALIYKIFVEKHRPYIPFIPFLVIGTITAYAIYFISPEDYWLGDIFIGQILKNIILYIESLFSYDNKL